MPATAFSIFPSNAWGGGHSTSVEVHPTNEQYVLVATDVSGIFISSDGGANFRPKNSYVTNIDERCVAAIAWDTNQASFPGYCYALVGSGTANQGNFLYSTNYGETWAKTVTAPAGNNTPVGHGNNPGDNLPNPQPRSTGTLIQIDDVNGVIYCGSYLWGMYRVARSGLAAGTTTWERIGFTNGYGGGFPATNYYVRSVMLGASDPDVLYVATHTGNAGGSGHVWRCTNPRNNLGVSGLGLTWVEFTDASGVNIEELGASQNDLFGLCCAPTEATGGGNRIRKLAASKTCAAGTAWVDIETPGTTVPISPTAPTAGAGSATGLTGTYLCAVAWKNIATGFEFGIGSAATVTVANQKINWTAIPTLTGHQPVLYRTIAGGGSRGMTDFFKVTTLAEGTTTFSNDNTSDASLQGNTTAVSSIMSMDVLRTGGVTYIAVTTIDADNKAPMWLGYSADNFATPGTWKNFTTDPTNNTFNDLHGPNVPPRTFSGWTFTPTTGGVNKYMFRNQGPGGRPWIVRTSPGTLWQAGRLFRVPNALDAVGSIVAYPQLAGVLQFAGRGVVCDRLNAARYYEAVLDSGFIRYTDRGGTPIQDKPTGLVSGANDGICVAIDPYTNPTTVYCAFADANATPTGNNKCEVWQLTDPFNDTGNHNGANNNGWNLAKDNVATTGSLGADSQLCVTGMHVMKNGATKYLVLHVRGSGSDTVAGIWRSVIPAVNGAWSWTRQTSTSAIAIAAHQNIGQITSGSGPNLAIFSGNDNSGVGYCFSRGSGIWLTTDWGANWTRIVAITATTEATGFVAVHPTDSTKIYYSRQTTNLIRRVDAASSASNDSATSTDLGADGLITNPSALWINSLTKKIYCCSRLQGASTILLESDCTTPGTTDTGAGKWLDCATQYARDVMFSPNQGSGAIDGSNAVALRGNNLMFMQFPSTHVSSNLPNPGFNLGLGICIS